MQQRSAVLDPGPTRTLWSSVGRGFGLVLAGTTRSPLPRPNLNVDENARLAIVAVSQKCSRRLERRRLGDQVQTDDGLRIIVESRAGVVNSDSGMLGPLFPQAR